MKKDNSLSLSQKNVFFDTGNNKTDRYEYDQRDLAGVKSYENDQSKTFFKTFNEALTIEDILEEANEIVNQYETIKKRNEWCENYFQKRILKSGDSIINNLIITLNSIDFTNTEEFKALFRNYQSFYTSMIKIINLVENFVNYRKRVFKVRKTILRFAESTGREGINTNKNENSKIEKNIFIKPLIKEADLISVSYSKDDYSSGVGDWLHYEIYKNLSKETREFLMGKNASEKSKKIDSNFKHVLDVETVKFLKRAIQNIECWEASFKDIHTFFKSRNFPQRIYRNDVRNERLSFRYRQIIKFMENISKNIILAERKLELYQKLSNGLISWQRWWEFNQVLRYIRYATDLEEGICDFFSDVRICRKLVKNYLHQLQESVDV